MGKGEGQLWQNQATVHPLEQLLFAINMLSSSSIKFKILLSQKKNSTLQQNPELLQKLIRRLLKVLRENEKMLISRILSCFPQYLYPS